MKTLLFAALAGVAVSVVGLTATGAFAKAPEEFLTDAIQGDNAEIKLGQLAAQRSTNAEVKNFGLTLVKDHTKAERQATSLAKELGITAPSGIGSEAQAEYTKLQSMQSPQFDSDFISFMVKAHQKTIDEFEEQAGANEGKTSTMAKAQLPVLKQHLSMAQSLEHANNQASR